MLLLIGVSCNEQKPIITEDKIIAVNTNDYCADMRGWLKEDLESGMIDSTVYEYYNEGLYTIQCWMLEIENK